MIRDYCHLWLQASEAEQRRLPEFWACNSYVAGSYDKPQDFKNLHKEINRLSEKASRLFYLALPPTVYVPVTGQLSAHCMVKGYVK